jgi:Cu/Ag efflux protein CusF
MTRPTFSAFLIAMAITGFSAHAVAQMDHSMHGSTAAMQTSPATAMAMTEGTVKKIDKTKGKVTVAHAAQSNGMPAMTMVYRVKDASLIAKMKEGQKIRFATDPADGGATMVRIETAQ